MSLLGKLLNSPIGFSAAVRDNLSCQKIQTLKVVERIYNAAVVVLGIIIPLALVAWVVWLAWTLPPANPAEQAPRREREVNIEKRKESKRSLCRAAAVNPATVYYARPVG